MTTKLLTFLLTLILCSSGFAYYLPPDSFAVEDTIKPPKWWTPDEFQVKHSFREAKTTDVLDHQFKFVILNDIYHADYEFERQEDILYQNIYLKLTVDLYVLNMEVWTKEKVANRINSQSLMFGWKWFGYGMVTSRYIIDDLRDAFYFQYEHEFPDSVEHKFETRFTTDFDDVNIFECRAEYVFGKWFGLNPFIGINFYIGDRMDRRGEYGLKYIAKTD